MYVCMYIHTHTPIENTLEWLFENEFGLQWELKMRPVLDNSALPVFKKGVLQDFCDQYEVKQGSSVLMIDDDPRVIESATKLGVQAFHTPWQTKIRALVGTTKT